MSVRALRWTLWTAAFLAFPLPFFGIETGLVPAGRMLMLSAVAWVFVVVESAQGVGMLMASLFLAQAVGWGVVFYGFAWGFARVLDGARPGFRQRVAFVMAALLIGIGVSDRMYVTPYSDVRLDSNLLEVYR